ncbi:MAG: hypothetical protein JNN01_01800 [Opitutaceae bacterium]|nr:hypothetical protein [Opitutaceae bacterium]
MLLVAHIALHAPLRSDPVAPVLEKVSEAKLLIARSGASVVLTDDAAYVIGGSNSIGPMGDIERIDDSPGRRTRPSRRERPLMPP